MPLHVKQIATSKPDINFLARLLGIGLKVTSLISWFTLLQPHLQGECFSTPRRLKLASKGDPASGLSSLGESVLPTSTNYRRPPIGSRGTV
jgi:hypothetical protein